MQKFIFTLCLLVLQFFWHGLSCAEEAAGDQKAPAPLYLPIDEMKGTVKVSPVEEGISLEANNATREEVLQGFADQEKIRVKFYCVDPAGEEERTGVTLNSASPIELLKDFLGKGYSFELLDEEGKPLGAGEAAGDSRPVKEVKIYPENCRKRERPLRTFMVLNEHPVLIKHPGQIRLEELSRIMKEEGPSSRSFAAGLLGSRGGKDAMPLLIEALKDKNPRVWSEALHYLKRMAVKFGTAEAAQAISERLRDTPYPELLTALAQLDKERVWPFIGTFVDNPDTKARNAAARALLLTGNKRAIPYLAKIASGEDIENSQLAIRAMGKIGGPEGAEALVSLLRGENEPRRALAAQAVKFLPEADRAKAEKEVRKIIVRPDVADEMLAALVQVSYLEPLKHLLGDAGASPDLKSRALGALAAGSEEAVETAGIAVGDSSPAVRLAALNTITEIGTENALPHFVRAAGDKEAEIRKAAMSGLARLGPTPPVLTALSGGLEDPDPGVRKAAIDGFDQFGKPDNQMVSILKNAAVNGTDPYVSKKASSILQRWGLEASRKKARGMTSADSEQAGGPTRRQG